MCIRHLGFLLLIWFPGGLHAQSAAQSCSAPRLDGGFFAPKQETYSDGTKLTYTCDEGRKPAVKGWWATSTCHNGKWSHEPQCIDEKACLLPDIPHAKYTKHRGWYRDGVKFRITCDEGYEPKDRQITATCTNGTWSSLPVCEKSISSCGEPPKVPHAVIINQEYREVFAADSEVQYECEDGYTVEGADTKKSIFCIAGIWTEGPTCSRETEPAARQGGSATAGGNTTSASSVTQPAGGGRETRPGTGGGSGGSGTQPAGGRSSSTSGSNDRQSGPLFRPVADCGAQPDVLNGDVIQRERMFLKYKCKAFYTLSGSDTVVCNSDRSWSPLPTCRDAYCTLNPAYYTRFGIVVSGDTFLKEGERKYFPCILHDLSSSFHCSNGRITFTGCCRSYEQR